MVEISLNDITRSYSNIKKEAFKLYKKQDIDNVLSLIDLSALIAASFNWLYTDKEVEDLLYEIAQKNIKKRTLQYIPNQNRIVFYDQIGTTACLGLQYLRGLMVANFEILYIFESSNRKCSPIIIDELKGYSKAVVLIIDSGKPQKIKAITELYNTILSFQPEKSIIHSPCDGAFGVVLWNALPQIKRYRIVPGDHHFYLGASRSDFFFEFRNYGYTIATEKRNIPKEQILFQPYYPIIDNNHFDEFPAITQNKIVILSAGAIYKTYGEDDLFFIILKKLLSDFPQIIILFVGTGSEAPFRKFIKINGLKDRLLLLGYRNDLNMCIANSDIYLATYPITGGLTTQYAAYYSKPILSFTTDDLIINQLDDIIGVSLNKKQPITHTNLTDFFMYAKHLILDDDFRKEEGNRVKEMLTTEYQFNKNLLSNLMGNNHVKIPNKLTIDYNKITNLYLDIENYYCPNLKNLIFVNLRLKYIELYYHLIFPTISSPIFYSDLWIKILRVSKRTINKVIKNSLKKI